MITSIELSGIMLDIFSMSQTTKCAFKPRSVIRLFACLVSCSLKSIPITYPVGPVA
jgi:hypothetical protein